MVELFKCPSCPCVFCSKEDLDKHLRVFEKHHLGEFHRRHEDLEFESYRLHGGADRQIRILSRIIMKHRELLIKEGEKKVKPRVKELFDSPEFF